MWMRGVILIGIAFAFVRNAWEWNQLTGGSGNYPIHKQEPDDEPLKARPLFWCWFGFVWIIGAYILLVGL